MKIKKGGVYFDNKNIKNELSLWQKQIGYVPQEIYLLDDSIKKNITFGLKEEEIDEKILLQTLKVSQLKDFVDTLPDAMNTFVGDRGVKLSGGERQRIGIARALYNLPKIMVFDEATSSLDIENENKILDEIYDNKDDKTLIIISHRNNTVKYCDLIYVLENGKVIDQGSFKEIMNKHGYLKETNIK
jgi:ABC-type multidrug transport system fused ATPase/permease subunit